MANPEVSGRVEPAVSRWPGIRATLALALALASWPGEVFAHKFYASLAQVEKTSEGRIEVGLRLFPDDVERALSASEGRRVVIGDTATFKDALVKYLDSMFVIASGGERARFRYVGIEAKVNLLWVFVEADWTRPLKGSRLTNRLLLDVSADQVNTVNLTEGDSKETRIFTAEHTSAELFAPAPR